MERKLLITGFDPFGGEKINPAWEAVKCLPDRVGGFVLEKRMVPTVFGEAGRVCLEEAEKIRPDVILCVGQAGGRGKVTPERVAINLRKAGIPDNAGNQPQGEPVVPGGPDGLYATVPVEKMASAIRAAGLPGEVSDTAGTFVCNDLLYTLLSRYRETAIHVGFIHVPFLPEQGAPSLPLSEIIRALEAAIAVC